MIMIGREMGGEGMQAQEGFEHVLARGHGGWTEEEEGG
jgi:hypothetical protein